MSSALVIGATGLVGRELLTQLLDDSDYESVVTLGRRVPPVEHARLKAHVIDFESPNSWSDLIRGDVLFSSLGTTRDLAGSQDAQWRVDYEYQLRVAEAASNNRVGSFILVPSTGANPRSPLFYPMMKGKLEEAVQELPFKKVRVLRPSFLEGHRERPRRGERLALGALTRLPQSWLPASVRPVPAANVARAARAAARDTSEASFSIWEAERVQSEGEMTTPPR